MESILGRLSEKLLVRNIKLENSGRIDVVNKKISSGLKFAFENNFPGPFDVVVMKKSTGREVLLHLTISQIEELSKNSDITFITTYLN